MTAIGIGIRPTLGSFNWTPLRLNPLFAMLPGIGSFRALTAGGAVAGVGDAVDQVICNTGQVMKAPSAAARGVWAVGANGRPYIDCSSAKYYVSDAPLGLAANPALTIATSIAAPNDGYAVALGTSLNSAQNLNLRVLSGWMVLYTTAQGENSSSLTSDLPGSGWGSWLAVHPPGRLTVAGTGLRKNGVPASLTYSGINPAYTPSLSGSVLAVGAWISGSSASSPLLSDVVIWDRVLTGPEIQRVEAWMMARLPT